MRLLVYQLHKAETRHRGRRKRRSVYGSQLILQPDHSSPESQLDARGCNKTGRPPNAENDQLHRSPASRSGFAR